MGYSSGEGACPFCPQWCGLIYLLGSFKWPCDQNLEEKFRVRKQRKMTIKSIEIHFSFRFIDLAGGHANWNKTVVAFASLNQRGLQVVSTLASTSLFPSLPILTITRNFPDVNAHSFLCLIT